MQAGKRTVRSSVQDRQIMRLGHALLGVFVGKDRGSSDVKMRVVIGMVEMPVGVDDVLNWSVAKAIESLFEPGPGGRNESVYDEFAVGTVEDYHGSAGAVEHGDIVSKLLRFHGNGIEPGAKIREPLGPRRRFASVAEPRNISRREVCCCKKLNFMFFKPFLCRLLRSWLDAPSSN